MLNKLSVVSTPTKDGLIVNISVKKQLGQSRVLIFCTTADSSIPSKDQWTRSGSFFVSNSTLETDNHALAVVVLGYKPDVNEGEVYFEVFALFKDEFGNFKLLPSAQKPSTGGNFGIITYGDDFIPISLQTDDEEDEDEDDEEDDDEDDDELDDHPYENFYLEIANWRGEKLINEIIELPKLNPKKLDLLVG
jgi:hypothetical protein